MTLVIIMMMEDSSGEILTCLNCWHQTETQSSASSFSSLLRSKLSDLITCSLTGNEGFHMVSSEVCIYYLIIDQTLFQTHVRLLLWDKLKFSSSSSDIHQTVCVCLVLWSSLMAMFILLLQGFYVTSCWLLLVWPLVDEDANIWDLRFKWMG